MTWAVPNRDAVTLGEMDGELLSVSPRDEAHVGDAFVRRGGAVFPPARVVCTKKRQPFGQEESLTSELDDDERHDAGAVRLVKQAAGVLHAFLFDDEQQVIRSVMQSAKAAVTTLLAATPVDSGDGDDDNDDNNDERLGESTETRRQLSQRRRMSASSTNNISSNSRPGPLDTPSSESIAAMSWHPALSLLAVAQRDGVVAFYNLAATSWDERVLDHAAQSEITGLAWAKCAGGVLAVACRGGVLLWKLQPKSTTEAPVLLDVLTHPTKTAFHHVSWNADGSLLAAAAKHSSAIYVYDTVFKRRTELQSPHRVASLHWSSTGEYLYAATDRGVSVMWETLTWKRETWDVATGSCGWSRDGRCLLVALRNQNTLFPYVFSGTPPSIDAQISSPAIDFAEKHVASFDQRTSELVGGRIERIAWDPSGTRIAMTYCSSSTELVGPLVVIFTVAWTPFLIFTRSGLLRGPAGAGVPRDVAFASSFEQGALLSVAWSNGLVTFHPFYFDAPQ